MTMQYVSRSYAQPSHWFHFDLRISHAILRTLLPSVFQFFALLKLLDVYVPSAAELLLPEIRDYVLRRSDVCARYPVLF